MILRKVLSKTNVHFHEDDFLEEEEAFWNQKVGTGTDSSNPKPGTDL